MTRLRILTWHVHGSYLYYLAHANHDFLVPVKPGLPEGYGGKCGWQDWPENLQEIPAKDVRVSEIDCVLFQSRKNYLDDQYEVLTGVQLRLPRIYLEHDPPREHPTDTRHPAYDSETMLIHCTAFNHLMWDSGSTPARVIEHGVRVSDDVRYTGELERGLVIVNGLRLRGRRLGADLFARVSQEIPLDLVGIGSEELGGLGEIPHHDLARFAARYRFVFNPIRYTSLGLAVCEAMSAGVPVVGLATTEMATVVQNGVSGYVDTRVDNLIAAMKRLLDNPAEAHRLSAGARRYARERFGIERFVRDWDRAFADAVAMVPGNGRRRPKSDVANVPMQGEGVA